MFKTHHISSTLGARPPAPLASYQWLPALLLVFVGMLSGCEHKPLGQSTESSSAPPNDFFAKTNTASSEQAQHVLIGYLKRRDIHIKKEDLQFKSTEVGFSFRIQLDAGDRFFTMEEKSGAWLIKETKTQ